MRDRWTYVCRDGRTQAGGRRRRTQTYAGRRTRSPARTEETDGRTGTRKATRAFTVRRTHAHAESQTDKGTSRRAERHADARADAQARRGRNTDGGRQKRAKKAGRRARTRIVPAGVSPACCARGNLFSVPVPGVKVSPGIAPSPSPPVGTGVPTAAWGLHRMGQQAAGVQGGGSGGDVPGGGGAQDRDSSLVQPCCRGQSGEDFAFGCFARNCKSRFSFSPVHASGLGLPPGRGLLGVPRGAELMGRGMHTPHLQAKHPAREHGSPGQDLPRDQWEVSDLWEQQHKM